MGKFNLQVHIVCGDKEFKPNDFLKIKMQSGKIIKGRFKVAYGDNYIPCLDVDCSTNCFTDIQKLNVRQVETIEKIAPEEVFEAGNAESIAI
jgi:hypothetical protein